MYAATFLFPNSSSSSLLPAAPQEGEFKNLKNGEKSPWTRGREEWSPVVGNNTSDVEGASTGRRGSGMVEGNGEIRFVPCL